MTYIFRGFRLIAEGFAMIFSPGPSPRVRAILERSDADAIKSDWQAVGDDLRSVIGGWERNEAA